MKRGLVLFFALCMSGEQRDPFASTYNEWVSLVAQRASSAEPNHIDVREFRAWQAAKAEWRKREREVDRFYRGGR